MVVTPVKTEPDEREKELASSLIFETYWTEEAYLALSSLNHPVELSEGRLVVYDMPTPEHQRIVRRLSRVFEDWVAERGAGEVLFAPMPVRLWPGKFREPDVMVYLTERDDRIGERYGGVPDLIAEVLSQSTQHIDRGIKFTEYAMAGVSEYWLVDPDARSVQVFTLKDGRFVLTGHFGPGQTVHSTLLPGCQTPTEAIFGH